MTFRMDSLSTLSPTRKKGARLCCIQSSLYNCVLCELCYCVNGMDSVCGLSWVSCGSLSFIVFIVQWFCLVWSLSCLFCCQNFTKHHTALINTDVIVYRAYVNPSCHCILSSLRLTFTYWAAGGYGLWVGSALRLLFFRHLPNLLDLCMYPYV